MALHPNDSRGMYERRAKLRRILRGTATLLLATMAVTCGGHACWDYFMDQDPWGHAGVSYSISVETETPGEYLLLVPLAVGESGEPFAFDRLDRELSYGEATYRNRDTRYGPVMEVTASGDFSLAWVWYELNPTSPTEATLSLTDDEYPRNATSYVFSSEEGLEITVHLFCYMDASAMCSTIFVSFDEIHVESSVDGWNEVEH